MRLPPANGHRDVAIAPGARSRRCLYSQRTEHPACLLESRVTFLAHMLDVKQQTAAACFMSRAPFLRTRPHPADGTLMTLLKDKPLFESPCLSRNSSVNRYSEMNSFEWSEFEK